MLNRRSLPGLLAVLFLLPGLTACDSVAPSGAEAGLTAEARSDHAQTNRLLAAARAATARYQDATAGEAAGWLGEHDGHPEPCVYHGVLGGMGYHYVNGGLMGPPDALDVTKPQALLYEPQRNGRRLLVGVEYIVPGDIVGPDGPAPGLFGQDFRWNPVQQIWALHVWIWRNNPSGMFFDWNPKVSCEFADFAIDVTSPPAP
jgi:hypothetical protein